MLIEEMKNEAIQTFEDEIKTAKNNWNFKLIINKNKVCDDGVILLIENLRRKK